MLSNVPYVNMKFLCSIYSLYVAYLLADGGSHEVVARLEAAVSVSGTAGPGLHILGSHTVRQLFLPVLPRVAAEHSDPLAMISYLIIRLISYSLSYHMNI